MGHEIEGQTASIRMGYPLYIIPGSSFRILGGLEVLEIPQIYFLTDVKVGVNAIGSLRTRLSCIRRQAEIYNM